MSTATLFHWACHIHLTQDYICGMVHADLYQQAWAVSKQSNGSSRLAGQMQLYYKRNGNIMKVFTYTWITELTENNRSVHKQQVLCMFHSRISFQVLYSNQTDQFVWRIYKHWHRTTRGHQVKDVEGWWWGGVVSRAVSLFQNKQLQSILLYQSCNHRF